MLARGYAGWYKCLSNTSTYEEYIAFNYGFHRGRDKREARSTIAGREEKKLPQPFEENSEMYGKKIIHEHHFSKYTGGGAGGATLLRGVGEGTPGKNSELFSWTDSTESGRMVPPPLNPLPLSEG